MLVLVYTNETILEKWVSRKGLEPDNLSNEIH